MNEDKEIPAPEAESPKGKNNKLIGNLMIAWGIVSAIAIIVGGGAISFIFMLKLPNW